MAQTTQEFLKSHIPLIDFLAELLGKNSEIVLHDLTNLDSSIIAIRNNYITKRDIGAPATDYVLRTLKTGINENLDFNVGYREISNRDHKQLHSASYYLRKEGEVVGMICVNTDESVFNELSRSIDNIELLLRTYRKQESDEQSIIPETFSRSIEEMAENTVLDVSISKGVPVDKFKQEDKLDTIHALYDSGFFLLKGAVPEIARILKISEPTVYRYLQNVKAKDNA
ncbi:hypothetical protein G7059_00970 [Erysipelothrix sp. HDW6A]|uniref:helix-turn-helix transcriptional regulator n=1 Tax=Erysipelothrix sp. HDW6A TaxID=2714928 RepID=UPI00140CF312|nr:PAS domain-containing protein [Erysipelothrix sp. HDW6A]QIK56510.1 hypothetical protein G7059_00970 [Erysipelothrix sp. HDW6A]